MKAELKQDGVPVYQAKTLTITIQTQAEEDTLRSIFSMELECATPMQSRVVNGTLEQLHAALGE